MAVNHQTLHLGEHRAVRRIVICAEHLAGRKNFDRRLFILHDMDLSRGGLGAEQKLRTQIEGILHVSGRMILRRIERREIVVIRLDLAALVDFKAHRGEDVNQFLPDLCHGMKMARMHFDSRFCDIDLLGLVAGCEFLLFHTRIQLAEALRRPVLQFVDCLAVFTPLVRRDAAHILHERADFAAL